MKIGQYPIPFDEHGNQLGYEYHYNGCHMLDNFVFDDTLTYKDFERGRSAAHMIMLRKSGQTVQVFLKDFGNMIPYMIKGVITGLFTFTKRGTNYGCMLVTTDPEYVADWIRNP